MIIEIELEDWQCCIGCPCLLFLSFQDMVKCRLGYSAETEYPDESGGPLSVRVKRPEECIEKYGR